MTKVRHLITNKFKSNVLSVFIHSSLSKEDVTLNALIPLVLKRGSKNYPTSQSIAMTLEELYGASLDIGIGKKGDVHLLYATIEFAADEFLPEPIFEKAANMIKDLLFNPLIENSKFNDEYVEQEKNNLKNYIQGIINDKRYYASKRCFEIMADGEAYGLFEYGDVADLENITSEILYKQYNKLISQSAIDIFFTGQGNSDIIDSIFQSENNRQRPVISIDTRPVQYKEIVEPMDVTQAKLSLGFKTFTSPKDDDYYALVVYNSILGAGVHSKLFNNVREKLSLAYYVSSNLNRFKGLLIISSGIEIGNYQKALDEILLQIKEIERGNITPYELDSSIKHIKNSMISRQDSPYSMENYYINQMLCGTSDNIEDFIKKIENVKAEDVVNVSQKIKLDTLYFLRDNAE